MNEKKNPEKTCKETIDKEKTKEEKGFQVRHWKLSIRPNVSIINLFGKTPRKS